MIIKQEKKQMNKEEIIELAFTKQKSLILIKSCSTPISVLIAKKICAVNTA